MMLLYFLKSPGMMIIYYGRRLSSNYSSTSEWYSFQIQIQSMIRIILWMDLDLNYMT